MSIANLQQKEEALVQERDSLKRDLEYISDTNHKLFQEMQDISDQYRIMETHFKV